MPSAAHPPLRRLFIAASGSGSPCLDLRRLSGEVADAAAGTDLGEQAGEVVGEVVAGLVEACVCTWRACPLVYKPCRHHFLSCSGD